MINLVVFEVVQMPALIGSADRKEKNAPSFSVIPVF
jgi:hypothetical protein